MKRDARIYIAGHTGLVGSALLRRLQSEGYQNLITRTHAELDLERQSETEDFFHQERPEYVIQAAAKVGGILANHTYPAEFIHRNLAIHTNVIHAAWKAGVNRLLCLGSSCVYPRECAQPMREEHLLTGPLEATNEPYAVAKIAAVKMCEAYNRQYGTNFISVMPTNLYGPNDNFDLKTSHVLPGLIRKFHLARLAASGNWESIKTDESRYGSLPDDFQASLVSISKSCGQQPLLPVAGGRLPAAVTIWGTGKPRREFLHVDDLAEACLYIMKLDDEKCRSLLTVDRTPIINIGCGKDISIKELALLIKKSIDFKGELVFDHTKPDGTPRKLLDVSRMANLGWKPNMSLRDGIEATYEWYLENTVL